MRVFDGQHFMVLALRNVTRLFPPNQYKNTKSEIGKNV